MKTKAQILSRIEYIKSKLDDESAFNDDTEYAELSAELNALEWILDI